VKLLALDKWTALPREGWKLIKSNCKSLPFSIIPIPNLTPCGGIELTKRISASWLTYSLWISQVSKINCPIFSTPLGLPQSTYKTHNNQVWPTSPMACSWLRQPGTDNLSWCWKWLSLKSKDLYLIQGTDPAGVTQWRPKWYSFGAAGFVTYALKNWAFPEQVRLFFTGWHGCYSRGAGL